MTTETIPAEVAEVEQTTTPPVETETIPKAELEELRSWKTKVSNVEGYTRRRVESATKTKDAEIERLKAELTAMPSGDANLDELRKSIARDKLSHAEREKTFQEQVSAYEQQKLQDTAVNLSIQYGIDAAELADTKTVVEMENKALKSYLARQKAQASTPKGIDLGKGGKGASTFQETELAYIQGKVPFEKYAEARRDAGLT